MESLESKLDRLSPEQRKEVEEFVDFLMYRSGASLGTPATAPVSPDLKKAAPPPLTVLEPVHTSEKPPQKICDFPRIEHSSLSPVNEEQVSLMQEIAVGGDDRITRDYMDYGQYEHQSSPAVIAVKNVKEKFKKLGEQEKPRVSLDWID
jgi:hypothetical protein